MLNDDPLAKYGFAPFLLFGRIQHEVGVGGQFVSQSVSSEMSSRFGPRHSGQTLGAPTEGCCWRGEGERNDRRKSCSVVVAVVVHRNGEGSVDDYGDDYGGRCSKLGPPSHWDAHGKDWRIANRVLLACATTASVLTRMFEAPGTADQSGPSTC